MEAGTELSVKNLLPTKTVEKNEILFIFEMFYGSGTILRKKIVLKPQ
jgi:hypothetical protein